MGSAATSSLMFVRELRPAERPLLFAVAHIAFVFIATLDVLFTWKVLGAGGYEINPIAASVIEAGGLQGMVLYKYLLVTLIIAISEYIGLHRRMLGMGLAVLAPAVTAIPVFMGASHLLLLYREAQVYG